MTPESLPSQGFALLDRLEHQELVPFIQRYLKIGTPSTVFYWVANAGLLLWTAGWLVWHRQQLGAAFNHLSNGILLAFLLIPLHEYIHALAYRWQGAPRVSYDLQWKKLIFMAVADRFVASRRAFQIVAWAPFVVISTGLLAAFSLASWPWSGAFLGALFTHTACCSGDFGLLSYFDAHRDREVVTYDDQAGKVSYFFVRGEG